MVLDRSDKNQDIYIPSLGIKQESRMLFSDFPLRVKNQEFRPSRSLIEKESGYFQILFLMSNKNREMRVKILKEEISRIKKEL